MKLQIMTKYYFLCWLFPNNTKWVKMGYKTKYSRGKFLIEAEI